MATITERRGLLGRTAARAPAREGVSDWLVKLTELMDDAIRIPGTSRRIGLDGIIGLIPGVGDAVSAVMGLLLLEEAKRLGVSRWTRFRMVVNFGLDLLVGAIPLLGDAWDFFFKAHRKNLRLLQEEMERRRGRA